MKHIKNLIVGIIISLCMIPLASAQSVPHGMKYQAVARDLSGVVIANQEVTLKIELQSNLKSPSIHYSETHAIITNKLGLFSLVIGEGIIEKGEFNAIPWSTEDIWMEISIKDKGESEFSTISNSKLLAVPYAFHAATATELINNNVIRGQGGVPSQNWSLFGNRNSDSDIDKLGTTDYVDLVMVTNDLERLRITKDGDINIANSLNVGNNVDIGNDLHVGNDTFLDNNVEMNIDGGSTINHGDFTVADMSSTLLTGTLTVDKETDLNSSLNVDGITDLNSDLNVNNASPTNLTGTLNVDGITDLNSDLNVNNASPTNLTGTLNVDGITDLNSDLNVNNASPTNLTGTLNVDGITDLNSDLNVNNASPTNLTGTLNVDGITDLNSDLNVNNASPTNLTGTLNVDGATVVNNTLDVASAVNLNTAGGATTISGATTVNNTTGLNGQVTINANVGGGDGSYNAYPLRVEGSAQGIAIKLAAGTPNNNNNFVTFFNSAGGAVGRIEGETLGEAASTPEFIYTNAILVAELAKAGVNQGLSFIPVVVGGVIVSSGPCGACIGMAAADLVLAGANLAAFNAFELTNLGVTYESGSADYAEWLERMDPNERISAGDIVSVTGGKISKYTVDARQFMVISTKPAMLGNMPRSGEESLYEKVAFMGKIPVKVRGIVFLGDYIIPSGLNDGVGQAVSPDDIKAEQYSKIVGVAWSESVMNSGIATVNMAIGLNNNDMARLAVQQELKITTLEQKFESFEARFLSLEKGEAAKPVVAEVTKKKPSKYEIAVANMPAELSSEVMEEAMQLIREQYEAKGLSIADHPGLDKLLNDASFRAETIRNAQASYKATYQSYLQKIKNQK